jgi:hypothetical protein
MLMPAVIVAAGCSQPVDLKAGLHVVDVSTGWFDQGIVDGKNKLVPSITFSLKNDAGVPISSVQLNAVFRRVGEGEEWDTVFLRGIDSNGLPPDAQTQPITVRSKQGYTSEEPRAEMLQHRLFVDARVQIFAKHGSAQWVELGHFPVERRLLTR